jgi:hypothetical protein
MMQRLWEGTYVPAQAVDLAFMIELPRGDSGKRSLTAGVLLVDQLDYYIPTWNSKGGISIEW